jgi:hypothetical protein
MNSLLQESIFQDDDEIAIFEVLFDFLKKELDKILIFNQSRKTNADLIKKRKKLLLLLLNLNDDELINDLAENGVSGCFNLIYFTNVFFCAKLGNSSETYSILKLCYRRNETMKLFKGKDEVIKLT